MMRPTREECGLAPLPPKEPDGLVGTLALKGRGWTEAGIKRFLGEPDKRVQNPRYKSSPPARLYALARVEACEATDEWQAWRAKAEVRSTIGRKAAQARKAALLAEVKQRPILVPVYPMDVLARMAVTHRNQIQAEYADRRGDWGDYDPATVESASPDALQRWCVNALRHACTNYDADLDGLYGQVGKQEAAQMVRRTVLDAIAAAYPTLAQECERQR